MQNEKLKGLDDSENPLSFVNTRLEIFVPKIGRVYRCRNNNMRIYVIGIIPDDEWPILAACLDDNYKLGQFQPSQLKEDTDAE